MLAEKMQVIGYTNPNGYFPSYLIVLLKASDGSIYVSWPRPDIRKISDPENLNQVTSFIPEKNPYSIEVYKENPTDDNIHIAFCLRENDPVKLLPTKKLYEYLKSLNMSEDLTNEEREIISTLLRTFLD